MIITERHTGRRYVLLKVWDAQGDHMQAATLRRYFLRKVYVEA